MNISGIHDCYGCGVCAVACKHDVIEIVLNEAGFYEPRIANADNCTDCGVCIDVCAYSHADVSLSGEPVQGYAGWSKNERTRRECSSGGVAYELGAALLKQGYKVCGVRYNVDKGRAEHYIARTEEELKAMKGSKYVQSYTIDAFRSINLKEKYLITGTPCQIDSFRRYIKRLNKEENFILADIFCFGIPSKRVWDMYMERINRQIGKIETVSWRNKINGWHKPYNMTIKGERGVIKTTIQDDMFYALFFNAVCLGKACYDKCKYRQRQSAADIRIGDFWGNTYQADEKGVNAVIALTDKGEETLRLCNCEFVKHPLDIITEGQRVTSPVRNLFAPVLSRLLKCKSIRIEIIVYSFKAFKFVLRSTEIIRHPARVLKRRQVDNYTAK